MRKRLMVLACLPMFIAFYMSILDTTIVNVSLPAISKEFNASMQAVSWVVNAYALTVVSVLLVAARFGDILGRKKMFMLGLALFTLASLLCGLSSNLMLLIIFRAIQGVGAAFIIPIVIPLLLDNFPTEKKAMIIGIMGALAGLAGASGPALGGILTDAFSWSWIFLINVPIGVAALWLAARYVQESYDLTTPKKVDYVGMVTLALGLSSLTLALLESNDRGWTSSFILTFFLLSIVSLLLFIVIERRSVAPMLPLQMFSNRKFTEGNIAMFFLGIGMVGGTFLIAFFLTQILGYTEREAGLLISSMAVGSMICSVLAARLSTVFGTRPFPLLGMLILGVGTYLLSQISQESSTWEIIWHLTICGAGTGMVIGTLTASILIQAPVDKSATVMGLTMVARTTGTVFGIAVLILLLQLQSEAMHTTEAFSWVFKINSLALLFGTWFAYRNGESRVREKELESQYKALSNGT